MLNCWIGGGEVGKVGGDKDERSGGISGDDNCVM